MVELECLSSTTDVISTGSSGNNIVKGFLNETIRLTCIVSPASDLTIIHFSFNNTIYEDGNYDGVSYDYSNGIRVNSTFHNKNCSVQSTLIIEQFSQEFVGQYSCAAAILFGDGVIGNNITFNVMLARQETGEFKFITLAFTVIIKFLYIIYVLVYSQHLSGFLK